MKIALFDFDGTLADSKRCSIVATQRAFQEFGLHVPTEADIIDGMGIPIEKEFPRLASEPLNEERLAQLLTLFRSYYQQYEVEHISAFPEIEAMLHQLKRDGIRTALVTSKRSQVAVRNLTSLGLNRYIDVVVGPDHVEAHKPSPLSVFKALELLDADPNDGVIVIGDAIHDIQMGKNAGVQTCAVMWGSHSRERLLQEQPDYLAVTPADIVSVFAQL